MKRLKIMARIVFFCFVIQSQAQDKETIAKGISISNFEVDNISDVEIKVTVNYSYVGKTDPEKFFIYAFPQDGEGNSMSRNVNTALIPLKTGNNQVVFTIKKHLKNDDFTSKSIKICMLAIKRKMYCQEFLFNKSWNSTIKHPRIISFTAKKTNIIKGDSTTLVWQTENAYNVSLYGERPNVQKVKPSGFVNISPKKTTTYRLNAKRSLETYTREPGKNMYITITVDSKPKLESAPEIVFFKIEPQNIERGEQVRFYWQINNAQKIQLFDSFGEIMSDIQDANKEFGKLQKINGEYMENLNKSETYILKATNNFGSVKKIFKVTVKGKKID